MSGESGAGSYARFSARLHERVLRDRVPVDVSLELTRRCSLDCAHCYNNLPLADAEARRGEESTAEISGLLAQLAEAGCFWLLLTGGELFARPDALEIYADARRRGFVVTLFTNATLITPRVADALAQQRPFAIEISLYGCTRETYERLTRVPGSFDRCLAGIRRLQERGLPLSIKTVVTTENHHEIWDLKRFVQEELGLPFKFDPMLSPRIDCSRTPVSLRLSPEQVVELDLMDPDRMREWQSFARDFIRPQQRAGHEADVYHCGAGIGSLAIDPWGQMSLCVLSQRETFDLRQGTVEQGWTQFLARVRDRKTSRVTRCTACQLKSVCGMCPANAELESGDPETPVDFMCQVAHLRALVCAWPIPPHGACDLCQGGARHEELRRTADRLRERHGVGRAQVAEVAEVVLPGPGSEA